MINTADNLLLCFSCAVPVAIPIMPCRDQFLFEVVTTTPYASILPILACLVWIVNASEHCSCWLSLLTTAVQNWEVAYHLLDIYLSLCLWLSGLMHMPCTISKAVVRTSGLDGTVLPPSPFTFVLSSRQCVCHTHAHVPPRTSKCRLNSFQKGLPT